jgi:hypothetical protein
VVDIDVQSQDFNRGATIANKVGKEGNERDEEEDEDDETDNIGAFSLLNGANLDLGDDLVVEAVGVLDTHFLVEFVADHFKYRQDYKICTQVIIQNHRLIS